MENSSRRKFGEIIARALALSSRTQQDVASDAGISRRTLSNIVNGHTGGQMDSLIALAHSLSDELHKLQIESLTEGVRLRRQADDIERAWIEITAMLQAFSLAKEAIESGTYETLVASYKEDLDWFSNEIGTVPKLRERAESAGEDLDEIRHWLELVRQEFAGAGSVTQLPSPEPEDLSVAPDSVAALDSEEESGFPEG